jgi:tetratricopeptide (TPR) repeat protein
MTALEKFKRRDVLRIVGITERELSYWRSLRLLEPSRNRKNKRVYSFSDLVRLRSVKALTRERVPARRLGKAVEAFRLRCPDGNGAGFTEARFTATGRRVAVDFRGSRLDPLSGQLLLPFEPAAPADNVSVIPPRSLESWLALAAECGEDPASRSRAIEAYRNIVETVPGWLEPRLNLGTLLYEDGDWKSAAHEFRKAVEIAPGNPLAHFNLASVLEDIGESEFAVQHFEEALSLAPEFADAHFNLAGAYEKLGASPAARAHWVRYLELDPVSEWAAYARQRLDALLDLESRSDSAAGSTR